MRIDPTLLTFLHEHNIIYTYHEHPPLFTVADSASLMLDLPGAHTKNLFLTDRKGGYYLLSVEAHKKVALNHIRKHLGLKELSFASPEDLYIYLQLTPGSVSIMGMIYSKNRVRCLLDKDLWQAKTVCVHPNRNDATIALSHETLANFFDILGETLEIIEIPEQVSL